MPIQLVVFSGKPLSPTATECAQLLEKQGMHVAITTADDDPPTPWQIFERMQQFNVFPPKAVLKLSLTCADVREALNAGTWAVGIVDESQELGISPEALIQLPAGEQDQLRETVRERFLSAGADAVIDVYSEVLEAIEALNGMI